MLGYTKSGAHFERGAIEQGGVMPEKTCPPHEWRIIIKSGHGGATHYAMMWCPICKELRDTKEIERRLNEHEQLAIGIDAFLSGATLLLMFSHASEAWSNFIIRWIKSFQAILSGGKDETE